MNCQYCQPMYAGYGMKFAGGYKIHWSQEQGKEDASLACKHGGAICKPVTSEINCYMFGPIGRVADLFCH